MKFGKNEAHPRQESTFADPTADGWERDHSSFGGGGWSRFNSPGGKEYLHPVTLEEFQAWQRSRNELVQKLAEKIDDPKEKEKLEERLKSDRKYIGYYEKYGLNVGIKDYNWD